MYQGLDELIYLQIIEYDSGWERHGLKGHLLYLET